MTLREFRSMLLGAELHIHTDHNNILNIGDSSQRRLGWISYVDEYGPELHYVKGSANNVADTFLCLAWKDTPMPPPVGKKQPTAFISNSESTQVPRMQNQNWASGPIHMPFPPHYCHRLPLRYYYHRITRACSWFWQRSGRGTSLARATAKPESQICNSLWRKNHRRTLKFTATMAILPLSSAEVPPHDA